MVDVKMGGVKRPFTEMYDYELSRKFRSKADFYTYLTEHVSNIIDSDLPI